MSARVGVFGATGYTGRELVRLLRTHPRARVAFTTGSGSGHLAHEAGLDAGRGRLPARAAARRRGDVRRAAARRAPATPSSSTSPATCACRRPTSTSSGTATSTRRRRSSARRVFGLTEVYRERLRGARSSRTRAATRPRCCCRSSRCCARGSSTTTDIVADAKSGATGAGRTLREDLLFCEVTDDFSAYSPGRAHRHVGEIEAVLRETTGRTSS